ncbi:MAG: GGDEF domain-containing protein, partial [Pseudomonadota bacterium]|nr:GGDEF domain-containing protein [Pseudomonadota bacterium]
VLQKYVMISIAATLLPLLVVAQYVHNRQSQRDKQYYRQIIDSVADIIYITNSTRIVDVNRHFFEFYSEFENIDQFLKQYRCVCDTFVIEEGFLQREMKGQYWLQYVLSNPNQKHKAKIIHNGKIYIFQIKIKPMQGQKELLYNVLMQDITQVEAYEKKLQKLTVTDELTGIGNRLACNETLSREIQRSHRYSIPLSLIMLDIDFFKKVNDTYGHDVGDLVLKEVACVVSGMLRDSDKVCRFGGEEFMVILPETNDSVAKQIAERIREAIKNLTSAEVPTQITMSLGVTTLTKWDSEATLIKRADKALYLAKERGRDRVEVDIELHIN